MNKVCYIFGGSGYIGRHIIQRFLEKESFDKIYVCDIQESSAEILNDSKIEFVFNDVRQPIDIKIEDKIDTSQSWIFNLAAVHREPGHEREEYFDTNISGAKNINSFAEKTGIKNLFFTSSIAPYGKSKEQRDESSHLYAETAYGISKGWCEQIHRVWQAKDSSRRLIIVRPSVIYGPNDPGNVYRMIKAVKKGIFFFPGDPNIVKAYGYVYGLVDSIEYTMGLEDAVILYNYAENPVEPLKNMVKIIKQKFDWSRPTPALPIWFLTPIAALLQLLLAIVGKQSPIHPVRVRKAGFPTNIKPTFLVERGFEFNYSFEKSLDHWKETAPEDFE